MFNVSDTPKTKKERCRHCHPLIEDRKVIWRCYRDRQEDIFTKIEDDNICENCPDFNSKYIEYPITVNNINVEQRDDWSLRQTDIGKLALIRPCGKEYEDKTYVGIFLGDLPCWQSVSFNRESGELITKMVSNPAIFVPALKKTIYGCESWWKIVEDESELTKEITDDVISSQWYVQLAKAIDMVPKDYIEAQFVSIWDGGNPVTTSCKVDMKTHRVFDIAKQDISEVDYLDREYIIINNRDEYEVVPEDEYDFENPEQNIFWYE